MPNLNGQRLLIVGAGGFIGGFIAREGLRRGMDVTAAVRQSTSRRYLTDPRLKFLTLDYDDPRQLTSALHEAGPWDYIIYNLGATKAVNYLDFRRVNYQYLRNFTEALHESGCIPERLLYVSSLSALGKGDEQTYLPLSNATVPNPDTAYGQSKIMAEQHLELFAHIPYIIFRPTGVYGPHELDYLMMIKSIDRHFDFGVGFRTQQLTFIYVDDLVNAMFQVLESGVENRKYIISEPRSYTQAEFRSIVAQELGRRFVIPIKLPLWALYAVCAISGRIAKLRCKPSTLNTDKYHIMAQRNWRADISDAVRDFNFSPAVDLREGIRRTVKVYREAKH